MAEQQKFSQSDAERARESAIGAASGTTNKELNRDRPMAGVMSSGDRSHTPGAAAQEKLRTGELELDASRRLRDRKGGQPPQGVDGTTFSQEELSRTEGAMTGEEDLDTVAGGWEGTDDATSTAPSDLGPQATARRNEENALDPDAPIGRAFGGGIAGADEGGVADLTGSPVEESRDWEHDPDLGDDERMR